MLGPGNDEAAKEALGAWPGGLQVAGGITDKNAQYWIDQGAEKVGYECDSCHDISVNLIGLGDYHIFPVSRGQIL